MGILISPSILAADFSVLGDEIRAADRGGADYIHVDMMDGHFVPNISFGMPVMASVRKVTKLPFDVHMMVDAPDALLPDVKKAGADLITVHAEACTHLHRSIGAIHELGLKAGVALNPATPLCMLDYVLEDADMFLIMTVNPGFGGQKLIPACFEKIRTLRAALTERGLHTDIEVDGGVTPDTIGKLAEAGANVFVAGSAVFHGKVDENIRRLREAAEAEQGSKA